MPLAICTKFVPSRPRAGTRLTLQILSPRRPFFHYIGDYIMTNSTQPRQRLHVEYESASCPADLNADTLVDNADFTNFARAHNEFLCP